MRKIILVDDDLDLLDISCKYIISKCPDVTVEYAGSGEECLKKDLKSFDLILLDYNLPDISGIELIEKIQQRCTTPVIMVTGEDNSEIAFAAIDKGAFDYVVKAGDYLKTLPVVINKTLKQVKIERENIRLQKEKDRYLESINDELDMAKKIQDSLVPMPLPEIDGLRLAARYIPTGKIGGDMFDIFTLKDDLIALFMFDVSGHGVPAALICSMFKILLRQELERETSPAQILTNVNNSYFNVFKFDNFITVFLAIFNKADGSLKFSRGGHPYPIVFRKNSNRLQILDTDGFAIGMERNPDYKEKTLYLKKGDRLFLFTDGIYEVFNLNHKMMGIHGFHSVIRKIRDLDIDDFLIKLVEVYENYKATMVNEDDISLLMIEYTGCEK
ncbi:MAG: SpoIIE family protein phosphatase [bacterium]